VGRTKGPFQIQIGKKATEIASGANHLVILAEDGMVHTLGCGEQGQLGRTSSRSSSRNFRHWKSLICPLPLYVKNKPMKAEKIWCTAYGTFIKQLQIDVIFAFGLNNYNQLTFNAHSITEFYPKPTVLKHIQKIAGRTARFKIFT